jgi:hypothetical protein
MNRDRAGGDVDCGCRAYEGAGKGYKGAERDISEQEKIEGSKREMEASRRRYKKAKREMQGVHSSSCPWQTYSWLPSSRCTAPPDAAA